MTPEEKAARDAKIAEYKGKVMPVLKSIFWQALDCAKITVFSALGVALYVAVTSTDEAQASNVTPISKAA